MGSGYEHFVEFFNNRLQGILAEDAVGASSSDMIQAEKLEICSRLIMAVVRALLKPEVGDS